jgi:hypothetical protein
MVTTAGSNFMSSTRTWTVVPVAAPAPTSPDEHPAVRRRADVAMAASLVVLRNIECHLS